MEETIETQIENVLDKVRPFLNRDGGDIELIGFKDGVVYVTMTGACEGCSYAMDDIAAGVDIILCEEVPGVTQVSASNDVPEDVMAHYLARKKLEKEKAAENQRNEQKEIELAKSSH